jgi:hypothetical protein
MNRTEAERRGSLADRVEALFKARPSEWIAVPDLMSAGGFCAWRTRVADARRRVQREGEGTIEWNGDVRDSRYRFLPSQPLGRDGGLSAQPELF